MNRASFKTLFLCIALVLSVSCGENRMLSGIEMILESNPSTADTVLSSMPMPVYAKNRALYAILKTQADYKLYKPFTSDSLISIATTYYGTRKKDYYAALAWYSQGCVNSEIQNDVAAIDAFIKAKELFPDTLVRYYALTEQYLGKLYLNQMMFNESLENLYGCLNNSLRLHDNVLTTNVRYMIGLNSLYQAHYVEAESHFNTLLKDPQASSLRTRQCYLNLAKIYLHGYEDYNKAMHYIDRYLYELKDPAEKGVGYSVKADIFFESGQYDSAYMFYNKSMNCQAEIYTVCDNSGRLAVLSVMRNNTEDAMEYLQMHDMLLDSIYDLRKDIAIEYVIHKHQLSLKENQNAYQHKRLIIISISLLMLIILSYSLMMSYKRNYRANIQIQQLDEVRNNSIEIMKAHILDTPFNDRHISRESILNLYKGKLDACKDLFRDTHAYSILSSKLINNAYSFELSEKTEIINQISESFIDSILDMNIEISNLNREDIVICILSLLKFNNRFISSFINISESGVRKRKLRLLEKASKDYIDLFM